MWSRFCDHTSIREQQLLVLFLSLSHFLNPFPPFLTLLACGSICMDRQIRRAASVSDKGVWVPSMPDGPAPMRHHLSYSRIAGGIGLASHVSDDFPPHHPHPLDLNFHERNRNNCPQVAFFATLTQPNTGSRLNSTSDSFLDMPRREGRDFLTSYVCLVRRNRKNEIS